MEAQFDYIVVGAGSAGCIVARRLSDDPGVRVLLLEAGGSDRTWKIRMPSAYSYPLADPRYSWMFETEPQSRLDDRRIAWPAGKVLGGTSSINGMVYVRGHALDYAGWEEAGATGWGYADVLPYFRKLEAHHRGGDAYRGDDGPVAISGPTNHTPLFEAFIRAGEEAGYGRTEDLNGFRQEGFGFSEMTVRRGIRCSAYLAYLAPVRGRANLRIETGAQVTRVILDGRGRATGVEYLRGGRTQAARAAREVVLSAGAIHSPRILMLSGVGPAEALRRAGVPVRHDLPGVGRNLQDHIELYVQFRCKKPVTLFPYLGLPAKLRAGAWWVFMRNGIAATNHAEAGGFIRSHAGATWPDVQFHFVPLAIDYHGKSPADGHSFQVHVGPTRPTSRGEVGLRSADPLAKPVLQPNYLDTAEDRGAMRACIRLTREVMAQGAMREFCGEEIAPGAGTTSDAALDAFVRHTAESGYHYAGTCRMGADGDAVTDPQGRVRGIEGLRVADASLMPLIVNGNTNAASLMIGEKMADHIKGGAMLSRVELPFHAPTYPPGAQRERPVRAPALAV